MRGRRLRCTRCREWIRVYELPREFIDPERYVCVVNGCSPPMRATAYRAEPEPELAPQLRLGEELGHEETRHYDPSMAAIPF